MELHNKGSSGAVRPIPPAPKLPSFWNKFLNNFHSIILGKAAYNLLKFYLPFSPKKRCSKWLT